MTKGGGSSTVNKLVYSTINFSRRVAIWQIVYIAILGASCEVFRGESESAVRIALARLGAEILTFKVLQIFRGQAVFSSLHI